MFVDSNAIWISGIKRTSNYQFKLTEKKIAKDLFSLYGLGTSNEFKAEFIDENTIGEIGLVNAFATVGLVNGCTHLFDLLRLRKAYRVNGPIIETVFYKMTETI